MDEYRREIERLKVPGRRKILTRWEAFNRYIFTRKVKLWLGLFAVVTGCFFAFTSVNIAEAMFFAFVVMALGKAIIAPRWHRDDFSAQSFNNPIYSYLPWNIFHEEK